MNIKFSTSLTEVFEYPSFDTATQIARDALKSNNAVVGSLGQYYTTSHVLTSRKQKRFISFFSNFCHTKRKHRKHRFFFIPFKQTFSLSEPTKRKVSLSTTTFSPSLSIDFFFANEDNLMPRPFPPLFFLFPLEFYIDHLPLIDLKGRDGRLTSRTLTTYCCCCCLFFFPVPAAKPSDQSVSPRRRRRRQQRFFPLYHPSRRRSILCLCSSLML